MSEKRKDSKGRILRTGESQRKDDSYQYRYLDNRKERRTVYASTLQELREKEDEIAKSQFNNIDYVIGKITVEKMIERHLSLKQNLRPTTKANYQASANRIKKDLISQYRIEDVKITDAKMFVIRLSEDGLAYSTVKVIHDFAKAVFKTAIQDKGLTMNPFAFHCKEVIMYYDLKRNALNKTQKNNLLEFVKNSKVYSKYLDLITILLGTGMRISEAAGLTKGDIDFANHQININHQLLYDGRGTYYIAPPKSDAGNRYIPMKPEVEQILKSVLMHRKTTKIEYMVGGLSGFVFLNVRNDRPIFARNFERVILGLKNAFNKATTQENQIPILTPHIFRHTFCSEMVQAGINIKAIQYIMGHSKVDMTLNRYSHVNLDTVQEEIKKLREVL